MKALKAFTISSGLAGLAGLAVAAAFYLLPKSSAEADASIGAGSGRLLPSWELHDVNGKLVKSSDFKGKVLIVDFWATWCPPCLEEIPGFIELQKKYGPKGLVIVGVSLDDEGPAVVKSFLEAKGMNYPVVMSTEAMLEQFGAGEGLPTTLIIDRSGKEVGRHLGFAPKSSFEKAILKLL